MGRNEPNGWQHGAVGIRDETYRMSINGKNGKAGAGGDNASRDRVLKPLNLLDPQRLAALRQGTAEPAISASLDSLRKGPSAPERLTAAGLPQLHANDELLVIWPALERQALKPASFPHIKALRKSPVKFPSLDLAPARLISEERVTSMATSAAAMSAAPAFVEPTLAEFEDLTKTASEPLWHSLFSPEAKGRPVYQPAAPAPVAAPGFARERVRESASDWGQAGAIDLGLSESKQDLLPIPEEQPQRIWLWQAIEGLFLSKAFSRAVAVAMVLLLVSTMDVPWRDWTRGNLAKMGTPIAAAVREVSQPVRQRAAFFITDDFSAGLENWTGGGSWKVDPAGWLAVSRGLALNTETAELTDYRYDFDAKIQNKAVGWVVRAPDTMNYYGLKLQQGGSASQPTYSLVRHAMVEGVKSSVSQPIEVPAHLAKADDFNRISVRVVGDQITTLVNGWGVDFWRDDRLPQGGVGLLADAGESALVRRISVTGNDDTWGLILYGAMESMRSVETFFSGDEGAPAAVIFYYPGANLMAQSRSPLLIQGR